MQECLMFGRIVWGHPSKAKVKKDQRGQPVLKDGQPVQVYSFGLAVEKAATMQARNANQADYQYSFEYGVWPKMEAEAKTAFPSGVPQGFSFKYKDGDGVDRQGKPYNQREGYAGHYVIAISTEAFAPPLYRHDGQQYIQIGADEVKCGDYVAVNTTLKYNAPKDSTHTPGIYINPQGVQFVAYGQAIINGPDAETMFGGQQFALPPGASTAPQMPQGQPGMPGTGQPQQPMQGGTMPGQMPMGQPQQPMQPMQGGTMPGQMPMGQPGGMMPGQPMQGGAPQQGQMPPPATDFIPGTGQPQQPMQGGYPGQAPMGQPGGMMPGQMPPR